MKTILTKNTYGYSFRKPEAKKDYSHLLVLASIVLAAIFLIILF